MNSQHIIITGGSSGIGKATAKLLVSRGANLSLIARNLDRLNLAKAEIEAARVNNHQRVLTLVADVSKKQEIQQAIDSAIGQLGTPHSLITCAGIAYPNYFQKIPLEVFEQTMAINYFGTLYSIKAVLPFMERAQKGHIVIISSGAGLMGIYGYSAYCPSKFALRGLAESLRGELKPLGVGVSIVYPPDTDTPQLEEENKTKPPETKLITGTAQMWSAEAVAKEIVRGVEKGQFAITPGFEITLLNRLHSLLLPVLNWYSDRLVIKARSLDNKP
jgi:3-dehydrosphinganine reductase